MKTAWRKGLDAQLKDDIEAAFKSGATLRGRLTEMLVDKYTTADTTSMKVDAYDSPGWAYRQADIAGYKRALNEVINLIS